jgi:hypothetical protein
MPPKGGKIATLLCPPVAKMDCLPLAKGEILSNTEEGDEAKRKKPLYDYLFPSLTQSGFSHIKLSVKLPTFEIVR